MKKKKTKRGYCIQRHHICYDPEKTVLLFRWEHWVLTLMGRCKETSNGFLMALKDYIKKNKTRAKRLRK